MSEQLPQSKNTQSLEIPLEATVAWGTDLTRSHPSRGIYQKFLCPRFIIQAQEARSKFKGPNRLQKRLRQNYTARENTPRQEWVHKFVHIMDPIAENGHVEVELRHGTVSGDDLVDSFLVTFSINKSGLVFDIAFR